MSDAVPHVTVCICTFRRPQLLGRLLESVARQETGEGFTYSVVVADNDAARSGEATVQAFMQRTGMAVVYCVEAIPNIARARNLAVTAATGDFIATIDDDEFADPGWLASMLRTCQQYEVAGVLGPVRPHFDDPPPGWLIKGGFCERPEHPTGRVMPWTETRTGNVVFRRSIIAGLAEPFDPAFGTGGEDKDFFMRMTLAGHEFRWCAEGVTYETVPRARWTRAYLLRRALLRGRNSLKLPLGRFTLIAKSVIAVPAYALMLPLTLPFGQHVFMRYCIRFCDHAGRLLALAGLNPVQER
jgi:glycosyltransferase involved in cell wall biosynthesis